MPIEKLLVHTIHAPDRQLYHNIQCTNAARLNEIVCFLTDRGYEMPNIRCERGYNYVTFWSLKETRYKRASLKQHRRILFLLLLKCDKINFRSSDLIVTDSSFRVLPINKVY